MADPVIKQRANTMYDNMEFPTYEYREFPMAVPVVNGEIQGSPYDAKHKPHPVVIVESQEEFDALRKPGAVLVSVAVGSAERLQNEDDIRAALYLQAEQTGVTIDKRWSVPRIEDTLRQAQAEKADVV